MHDKDGGVPDLKDDWQRKHRIQQLDYTCGWVQTTEPPCQDRLSTCPETRYKCEHSGVITINTQNIKSQPNCPNSRPTIDTLVLRCIYHSFLVKRIRPSFLWPVAPAAHSLRCLPSPTVVRLILSRCCNHHRRRHRSRTVAEYHMRRCGLYLGRMKWSGMKQYTALTFDFCACIKRDVNRDMENLRL